MNEDPKLLALRRGMLEPFVLASVEHRRRYAVEIAEALGVAGYPVLEGTLYPLLNRLRRDGLVEHEWQESPAGPPRKYLSLTPAGSAQLAQFRDYWAALTDTLATIGK